jgi:hypothetical protein
MAEEPEKANAVLHEILKASRDRFVANCDIGTALLGTNQVDLAMQHFKKSIQDRDTWITILAVDPLFADFRDNPDFQEIILKTGIEAHWIK